MAWRIEFERAAEKDIDALDAATAKRILRFLSERIAPSENPRSLGEALKGARLAGLWKYRVGDYRVIVQIRDREVTVAVVRIGNRKDVYRR